MKNNDQLSKEFDAFMAASRMERARARFNFLFTVFSVLSGVLLGVILFLLTF